MPTPRARSTIALGLFVLIFVFAAMAVFLGLLTYLASPRAEMKQVVTHLVGDLSRYRNDEAGLRHEVDQLGLKHVHISIYAPSGRFLASNVTPPLPGVLPAAFGDQTVLDAGDELATLVRDHGEPVMVGVIRIGPPAWRVLVIPVLGSLAVLAVLVVLLARHVGLPLQRIAHAARRFGEGDLTARARIRRGDELGHVALAFDQMADRVMLLMSAQRELMANVSHELQTPLARIQVAIDLMVDGIDDGVIELLPEISRDLAELERLIDDVMTLSRLELAGAQGRALAAPLRLEACSLTALIEIAGRRFRAQHPDRVLAISAQADLPPLQLDTVLLRRALENLLDNAQKYSARDTPVALDARSVGQAVRIEVSDRGIGIEAGDLSQLFTPFFRTDRSRTRSSGGFGLGLVLARRVIEAHGGTIAVASVVNDHTTVTIDLPATGAS